MRGTKTLKVPQIEWDIHAIPLRASTISNPLAMPSMGNYYERNKVKAKFAYSLSARIIIIPPTRAGGHSGFLLGSVSGSNL